MSADRSNVHQLSANRRKFDRVRITEFLRIYCVDGRTMSEIQLVDASEEGCALQLKATGANPVHPIHSEIQVRAYFSSDTFLSLTFRVMNSRSHIEDGSRYEILGCSVDKGSRPFAVYAKFIEFLKMYAENAERDLGDVSVSYL